MLSNWPSTLYANQTFFKLLGTLLPQPPEVLDLQSCATKPIQEIIVLAEYLKCEHQTQVHSMRNEANNYIFISLDYFNVF